MTHPKPATMDAVLERITELRQSGQRLVVAIDGRGGAGKSSMARWIVEAAPKAALIEYDWFHLPKKEIVSNQRFDRERLIKEALKPFFAGERMLKFLRYNWGDLGGVADGLDSRPVVVEDFEVMVLEGCGTLHPELLPYYQIRIWIGTDAEESLRRGLKRDIEEYKLDPIRVAKLWEEWALWEKEELAQDDRSLRAEFLIR